MKLHITNFYKILRNITEYPKQLFFIKIFIFYIMTRAINLLYVFYNNDLFEYAFVGSECLYNLHTIIYKVEKMILSSTSKDITSCQFESS